MSAPGATGTAGWRRGLPHSLPVRLVRHAVEATVAAVVLGYAALICAQVFFRYVLNDSLVWSEELVRYGLLWGVMLGAAVASDRHAHIALEPLKDVLAPARYRQVRVVAALLVLVFCAIVGWYAWDYLYRLRFMASPAMQLPMKYVFAAIPTGCTLMAFFTLVHLVAGTAPPAAGADGEHPR
ncbi:MAG: TRAP transporter small permease [Rhodobacteraceae bacterium]|jgi:TRAP-type C4-dicarboxylate transport system permease small subunit|nr:TRAP transporter small permease [Paracoccaceae bacterium]